MGEQKDLLQGVVGLGPVAEQQPGRLVDQVFVLLIQRGKGGLVPRQRPPDQHHHLALHLWVTIRRRFARVRLVIDSRHARSQSPRFARGL